MDVIAIIAALGVFIVASPAFFFLGRRTGTRVEHDRQTAAKATAEETASRIVGDAERERVSASPRSTEPTERSARR
jgi:hypothetical protein